VEEREVALELGERGILIFDSTTKKRILEFRG
jgi:hypothetical protein